MPRKAKPRPAAPNRVDLAAPVPAQDATQPIRAPAGLPYGQRQQIEQAQRAQPLPQAGQPAPPQGDPFAAALAMAPPPEGGATRPTERPDEPVTAGMRPQSAAQNPDLERLRAVLPALEFLSTRPNAMPSTINYVRYLRAMIPEI